MTGNQGAKQKRIAGVLGASRVIRFPGHKSGGPLSWLGLAQALQSRLVSRGGRPSDPRWDTKRLVPFRGQVWKQLAKEAKAISAQGRKVGPAQLAAIMIEESLTPTKGVISEEQVQVYLAKSDWEVYQSFDNMGTGAKSYAPLALSSTPTYQTILRSAAECSWPADRALGDLVRSSSIGV